LVDAITNIPDETGGANIIYGEFERIKT